MARKRRAEEAVEDLSAFDDIVGDDEVEEGEEGWPDAEPEEAPEPEPEGLASQHAEHMELVDSSPVHNTPAVWLLIGMDIVIGLGAWVLAAAAITTPDLRVMFVVAALIAAAAAILIAVSLRRAKARFVARCETCVFDVKRRVGPDAVVHGDMVEVELDASACEFPTGLDVDLRDHAAPGFEAGRRIILTGPEVRRYRAKATRRGSQAIELVHVRMKDPGGLWRHTRTYSVPGHVEVRPGTASLALRNMLNSRTAFPDGAPKALVNLFRDVEHDQLRTYQGGDRMKDVDWKRMSMTGQMMVKDRIVESLDVGLLLIDAGTSMRLVDGGLRNLDFALEAASEIIQEAGRRNHQIGFLAFDDEHIIEQMAPTRSRLLYPESQKLFQNVADREPREDAEDDPEPVAISLQRALRKMVGARMGVLPFSDLETIDEGIVQSLSRLGGDGAKVGVLILPQPSMEAKKRAYRRYQTRPAAGKYRGKSHRRELRELLSIQGIETMELPR